MEGSTDAVSDSQAKRRGEGGVSKHGNCEANQKLVQSIFSTQMSPRTGVVGSSKVKFGRT
jgi:hypothetical protein